MCSPKLSLDLAVISGVLPPLFVELSLSLFEVRSFFDGSFLVSLLDAFIFVVLNFVRVCFLDFV